MNSLKKTFKEDKMIADLRFTKETSIEEVEKQIGENLKIEIYVEEMISLVSDASKKL